MPAPVRPSDFEALIVQPEDKLRDAIIKTYVKLPILVYQLQQYLFDNAGAITTEFESDICAVGCDEPEEEETT